MRSPHQLLTSRARVRPRYALLPLEGYPPSNLPAWTKTEARILASPALGTQFAEFLLSIESGGGTRCGADERTESFFYVMKGAIRVLVDERPHELSPGGFALVPPSSNFRVEVKDAAQVLLVRKLFEPAPAVPAPRLIIGNEKDVPAEVYMGDEHARLQTLIPDELVFDLAMNIFTFDPDHGLPVVETHVMEHGLFFLQGKGLYYLDGEWMEVEKNDFIWMGPYCPQSFYATGPTPAKYIYYKNVNRDVQL